MHTLREESQKIMDLGQDILSTAKTAFDQEFHQECSEYQKNFSLYASLYDHEEVLIVSFQENKLDPMIGRTPLSLFISKQRNTPSSDTNEEALHQEENSDEENEQEEWLFELLDVAEFIWKDYFQWKKSSYTNEESLDDYDIGPEWMLLDLKEEKTTSSPNCTKPIYVKMNREDIEISLQAEEFLKKHQEHHFYN
jgi:hypothetical protein